MTRPASCLDAGAGLPDEDPVRLVIFHYHDRPGGVRQVISHGLPQLLARLDSVQEVVLLMGEVANLHWVKGLALVLNGASLRVVIHREFGYSSGDVTMLGTDAVALLGSAIAGTKVLVWAHNLSVGRTLPMLRHLPGACARAGAQLWLHHHDWWWDGRWARWGDWRAASVGDLEEALEISLPTGPHIRHMCINQADLSWVRQRAGSAARWVGNPLPPSTLPDTSQVRAATSWLRRQSQGRRIWLAPVRALRRKNLAEALFLVRQQAEPTCLVTTGGPGSSIEVPAWESLCHAAAKNDWPFSPSVLARPTRQHPAVPDLMVAADAVIMPSLQEGFGLPYLEAAAFGKPLLARSLPDVSANLAALGCTLPGSYSSLPVDPASFDAGKENARLAERWLRLQSMLPTDLREDGAPEFYKNQTDFGSLSLEAQLEVLQSDTRPVSGLTEPRTPQWPEGNRVEHWADRFFGEDDIEDSAEGAGKSGPPLPTGSLLPEVRRRFRYWQEHPLLWP